MSVLMSVSQTSMFVAGEAYESDNDSTTVIPAVILCDMLVYFVK